MKRAAILAGALAVFVLTVEFTARADYAVMRSGARLHITSYQRTGDRITLTVPGGTLEVAATDVVSIEPEEVFTPNPPAPAMTGPYAKLIETAASKHGVDEELIERVIAEESNFNPRAVSRKDAQGLMQLMPETAARYSVANVFDPGQNIDAGAHYLKDLLDQYQGNLSLALAAYNAGPDMVARYGGIPPFPETQSYVRRITAEMARKNRETETKPQAPPSSASATPNERTQTDTRNDTLNRARQALFTAEVEAVAAAAPLAGPGPDHQP